MKHWCGDLTFVECIRRTGELARDIPYSTQRLGAWVRSSELEATDQISEAEECMMASIRSPFVDSDARGRVSTVHRKDKECFHMKAIEPDILKNTLRGRMNYTIN